MLNSEDKILIKTCGKLKHFLPEDSSRKTLTKIKRRRLSTEVAHNQFKRTHCRKPSASHHKLQIIFLAIMEDTVKVKLQILYLFCRVFIPDITGTRSIKINHEIREMVTNKVAGF